MNKFTHLFNFIKLFRYLWSKFRKELFVMRENDTFELFILPKNENKRDIYALVFVQTESQKKYGSF